MEKDTFIGHKNLGGLVITFHHQREKGRRDFVSETTKLLEILKPISYGAAGMALPTSYDLPACLYYDYSIVNPFFLVEASERDTEKGKNTMQRQTSYSQT